MQLSIAIAQLAPKKGDYAANLSRLTAVFQQLATLSPRPDLLLLPETALTGYFLEGGVREVARSAGELAADVQRVYLDALGTNAPPLDLIVGFYERHRDRFYNSAAYLELGPPTADRRPPTADVNAVVDGRSSMVGSARIRHVHRKVFLPTYGVFDEGRFVEPGQQIAAFDTRWGRAAILICEDAWHSLSGTVAALDGAQVVFVPSASPARGTAGPRPSNVEHWEDLMHRIADEHGVYTVLAQLVGFEGGKGFPGCSLLLGPHGDTRVSGPLWDEALISATIDLSDLPLARADQPLLADLETLLPHVQAELGRAARGEQALVRWDAAGGHFQGRPTGLPVRAAPSGRPSEAGEAGRPSEAGEAGRPSEAGEAGRPSEAPPFAPLPLVLPPPFDPDADLLRLDAAAVQRWLVAFLRDEVTRRRGFKEVVVALSGGVDSALVVYLCAQAFGPKNVTAIRMPYRTSSKESLEHAQLVIDDLGVNSVTVDISVAVDGYATLDPQIDGRRKGNIMARTRMIVLFDQSQKRGCIPIGTGNKTERLFGYYTWHADDSPPVNPIGDLFKSQVWQLSRQVGVPQVIVEKPASADLIVGQTDEGDFGISYPRADKILHFLLNGYAPERVAALGFGAADVALVKRRLDGTHWKRHLPSTAMLSPTAIGEYYLRPLDF